MTDCSMPSPWKRVFVALPTVPIVGLLMVYALKNLPGPTGSHLCAVRTAGGLSSGLSSGSVPRGSVEDLNRRLVHVTAISDNHFDEAQDMLSSVECCLPENKIIVYDLGLNEEHRLQLTQHYSVELRIFPFANYSHIAHVKNLMTYAWKPIIIKEVSLEYDIIMYCDASIRMISCDINKALGRLVDFPIFASVPLSYRAIEFTHNGMINYLHYPKDRKDIAGMTTIAATGFLLWANAIMREKLIDLWLDCALHKECIAPEGATLGPCHSTNHHDGHYIGCHRYDQSALNLILAREFGPELISTAIITDLAKSLWAVRRRKQ